MRQRDELDVQVKARSRFRDRHLTDNVELIELGEAEGDADVVKEAEAALAELRRDGARGCRSRRCCPAKPTHNDCLSRNPRRRRWDREPGLGVSMLLRMYTRWAERRKFKVEMLEIHAGEEAGIKSATIQIKGHNAYGWLKTESGVHRLVRISPYDSAARRHTSFSSAWVYPVVDDTHQYRDQRVRPARSTPTARPAPAAST